MYQYDPIDTVRADQIAEARKLASEEGTERKVISLPAGTRRPFVGGRGSGGVIEKKKNVLKGHEAFLKALEMNGAKVEVEKCDGTLYRGVLKHTDKYSLTVYVTERGSVNEPDIFDPVDGRDRVIFKHDISEFSALTPRQAPTEGNE